MKEKRIVVTVAADFKTKSGLQFQKDHEFVAFVNADGNIHFPPGLVSAGDVVVTRDKFVETAEWDSLQAEIEKLTAPVQK